MSKKTDFEEMVETEDTHTDEVEVVDLEKVPTEYDPEWSEYLLDKLSDHELINGAPTVDGLRRITEKCFGEIIESRSWVVETPTSENNQRCTLGHTLTMVKHRNGQILKIDGCVDVVYHKTCLLYTSPSPRDQRGSGGGGGGG